MYVSEHKLHIFITVELTAKKFSIILMYFNLAYYSVTFIKNTNCIASRNTLFTFYEMCSRDR